MPITVYKCVGANEAASCSIIFSTIQEYLSGSPKNFIQRKNQQWINVSQPFSSLVQRPVSAKALLDAFMPWARG